MIALEDIKLGTPVTFGYLKSQIISDGMILDKDGLYKVRIAYYPELVDINLIDIISSNNYKKNFGINSKHPVSISFEKGLSDKERSEIYDKILKRNKDE